MRPFLFAKLFLFILFFNLMYQAICCFTLLPLLAFSLLPLFMKFWLVEGGFAWRTYNNQNPKKLNGPMSWPFLGFLPQMGSHAHSKLASTTASMGLNRLMAFSLGSTRLIISSHPDTAKEILCGSSFSDRPIKESARLLMFELAIGFAPSGSYWRHLRRIAATHMFLPRRIASLEGVRQAIVKDMIGVMDKEMSERGFVEVRGVVGQGSLRNVLESVFGSCLGSQGEELGFMVKEGYELIGEFNWGDYFPFGFLDFGGTKRKCHRLAGKVNDLVGHIVQERKIEELNGKNDFLSVLLSLPKEDQLDDADLVAVLSEMIFRGTDTVAILVEWIMARMVLHQDVQAKAQEEIDTCVGYNRHVQDSDIPNLPYLQAIVKEVLRLHPPGPLLSWARLAVHDVYVDKCFIPAGTTAMVNMWAITHDPTIWNDPWAFRPERFMEEEEVSIMGSDLRLAPFGSGRRVSPGRALGYDVIYNPERTRSHRQIAKVASDKIEMEKSEGKLKHLGFVRVFTVNAAVIISNLYDYAKQNSGPLKSTVGTVENAVTTVVRPVYEKFKDVPDDVLVFLDKKVDEATEKFDEHAPPVAKKLVSQAQIIVQKASHVAQDLIQEARVSGPRAAIIHAGEMSKQFGVTQFAVLWYHVNLSPALHSIAEIATPTASHWSEKYNKLVKDMKEKGYDIFYYVPLVPVEEISKAYKQVEAAATKKDDDVAPSSSTESEAE